ncbi:MAG TPA: site-specific integrase, partial [Bryobacteraceae bacterium]|nr:site-specific integrase [Bryobacteraceae bacterium]
PLDEIGTDLIAKYIAFRRRGDVEVATINRELATLRRAFHLAQEWGRVDRLLPRVKMLPGENRREQVLSPEDEAKYLEAAAPLLRDVATILIDCALRPEEAFRLRWEQVRDGAIEIFRGKAKGSRRRVPCSERVLAAIERRRGSGCDWVFPAPTKSGHIEASSLKKQHAHAVEESKVPSFVLYVLRHTCITRWSRHMDPYTLHVIAGHADMNTTKRYVHPSDADVRAAMDRARTANTSGPSAGDTATPPR